METDSLGGQEPKNETDNLGHFTLGLVRSMPCKIGLVNVIGDGKLIINVYKTYMFYVLKLLMSSCSVKYIDILGYVLGRLQVVLNIHTIYFGPNHAIVDPK